LGNAWGADADQGESTLIPANGAKIGLEDQLNDLYEGTGYTFTATYKLLSQGFYQNRSGMMWSNSNVGSNSRITVGNDGTITYATNPQDRDYRAVIEVVINVNPADGTILEDNTMTTYICLWYPN
jgi:hypothetical protein